jgi:hypothetical protein
MSVFWNTGALRFTAFFCDPFPDIRRAISELDSIGFPDGQKFYCLAVDENKVVEIKNGCACFFFEQVPKQIHILAYNLAADMQEYRSVVYDDAFDSASHCGPMFSLHQSKLDAIFNLLKTKVTT